MNNVFEVTEVCPSCEAEVTMIWDVNQDGYKAYCPHCGGRLMLCSMCDRMCDYDSETDSCKHNKTYNRFEWIFDSHGADSVYSKYDGMSCVILHNVSEDEVDVDEVGNMYVVMLSNGMKIDAFEDELYKKGEKNDAKQLY